VIEHYSIKFHLFLTSALVLGEQSVSHTGRFILVGNTSWYLLDRKLGELKIVPEGMEKRILFRLLGLIIQPLSHQPAASCYTDCTIPAQLKY
jgi:hypothetical protein